MSIMNIYIYTHEITCDINKKQKIVTNIYMQSFDIQRCTCFIYYYLILEYQFITNEILNCNNSSTTLYIDLNIVYLNY